MPDKDGQERRKDDKHAPTSGNVRQAPVRPSTDKERCRWYVDEASKTCPQGPHQCAYANTPCSTGKITGILIGLKVGLRLSSSAILSTHLSVQSAPCSHARPKRSAYPDSRTNVLTHISIVSSSQRSHRRSHVYYHHVVSRLASSSDVSFLPPASSTSEEADRLCSLDDTAHLSAYFNKPVK